MKYIYLPSFKTYHAAFIHGLKYERVGKLPIVKVSRQRGDLPFFDYFKMHVFYEIGSRLSFTAKAISYRINVSEGMEKDVTWRKEGDVYIPHDRIACEDIPDLARKTPPTQKVIRKGYIHDTGKPRVQA